MDSMEIQAPILAISSDLQIATDKTTKDKNSLKGNSVEIVLST